MTDDIFDIEIDVTACGEDSLMSSTDLSDIGTITLTDYNITSSSQHPYIYTTTNTGTNPLWNGINGVTYDDYLMPNNTLHVKGDAEFEGDLKIKGQSILESLQKIEDRLAILHPNQELESRWDELKELGEKYRQLEQEILDKEKVWDIIKR